MRKAILLLCCVVVAYGQQKGGASAGLFGAGRNEIGGGLGQAGDGMGPGGPGMSGGLGVGGQPQLRQPEGLGAAQGGAGLIGYPSGYGQQDLFTLLLRQIMLAYGADPLKLPDTTIPFSGILRMSGTVHTYNSYVFGLSHVIRTGPCVVKADNTGMRLRLDLGINNVFGNTSATVKMANSKTNKHRVQFTVFVRQARAILEIAQSGPQDIQVTNFKIIFLKGFKLFLKPQQCSKRPIFRTFLRAAEAFLDRSVRKRLEPLVRKAIDQNIKAVLVYLSRQAQLRPKPRLSPELFANVPQDIVIGRPQDSGFPSGAGGPGGGGPGGAGSFGGLGGGGGPSPGGNMLAGGGSSGVGGGAGPQGIGAGGRGFGPGSQLQAGADLSSSLSGSSGQQKIGIAKGL
ncbi:glycine, alanine and asparagine-rich protein [Rhipicephalus sanguineus]|uniref:glycine, alanine and asparagine-rich protein n=1 Tax=Rhipicephalus sanguineus TaxID=34632 RepID=UPI001893EE41|nr:glycine, alanine and asparagine-rich protein [Rhipicephalus sanguineus]